MNIQESIRHIKKLHYKKIFNKYFIPYFPLYNTNHVKQLYIETPQVLPVQQNLQSVTLTTLTPRLPYQRMVYMIEACKPQTTPF